MRPFSPPIPLRSAPLALALVGGLLATSCATRPDLRGEAVQLSDLARDFEDAYSGLQAELLRTLPAETDLHAELANATRTRLDAVHALSRYGESVAHALVPENENAEVAGSWADALEVLLVAMAEPGMPVDAYMAAPLRGRLVRELRAAPVPSQAAELVVPFSTRIAEACADDLQSYSDAIQVVRVYSLEQIRAPHIADAAYRDDLLRRQEVLREAVQKKLDGELPPGWDPSKDLAEVEGLLATTAAAEANVDLDLGALSERWSQYQTVLDRAVEQTRVWSVEHRALPRLIQRK